MALSKITAAACLVALSGANRLEATGPGAQQVAQAFKDKDGTLCGTRSIKEKLSADSSVQRIRSLPWDSVMATADDFIRAQEGKVKKLQAELATLQTRVEAALKSEAPAALSDAQIKSAVEAALTADGSYGTVAKAVALQCGAIRPRKRSDRAPRGAYEAAEAAFKEHIAGVLEGGKIRVDGDKLRAACESMLQATEEVECVELCQSFADEAQAISDSGVVGHSGTGPSADELLKQAEAKANELRLAQSDLSDCKTAKTDLDGFRQELEGLQVQIKDEFAKVRAAKNALYDAEDEMYMLEDDMADQADTVKELEDSVKGKGEVLDKAQDALKDVSDKNDGLREAIKKGEETVRQAIDQVKRASAASQAAQELRGQVSTLMLKLTMYFDAAVRQPIRDLGLGEGVTVSDYFPATVRGLSEAQNTEDSLSALRSFCDSGATKKAFAEVVGSDPAALQELCSFGSVATVDGEIDGAVSTRMKNVKKDLEGVQSWLNEFKGEEGMTKAIQEKNVAAGEPEGLRQVTQILDSTAFYTGYLVHWQVDQKFVKLLAGLEQVLAESQSSQADFEKALDQLRTQLQAGVKAYEAAVKAVKTALEEKVIEESKRAEAKKEYDALVAEQKALEDKLDALEAALKAAQAAYKAAIKALETSHKQGTSFLEMIQNQVSQPPRKGRGGRGARR